MAWPGRSEKHPSKNAISKDVILFVFVAYSGDMSLDDVMSPDVISDIISDGMMMPSTNSKWRWKLVQVAMVFKNICIILLSKEAQ